VKKLIRKLAYKFSSTEVKMLIDKLEENGERISLNAYAGEFRASHGYLHIVNNGRFSFAERVALASTMNKLHRASTKIAIIETLFEGKDRGSKSYIPGETISQRMTNPTSMITPEGVTKQALKILADEMEKDIHKAYKTPIQTAEVMRQKGLL